MQRRNAISILIIPALVAGMFVSCVNDLDRVAAVEVPKASADRITTDAEYLFTDSGLVRNRLRSGRIAEWSTEPKRTELSEGLELVFYNAAGEQSSVLTARRGVMVPDEKRMEVNEQVVFINAKGERLETEQLTWDQDSAQVYTDRAVRIQRGGDIIHGQGLVASEDFSRYTISRITGILDVAVGDTLATP
ncbi:MAG: LPS export ABC transporter periplasmic protein LptC [Flavobacteriales bacterium]